MRRDKMQNIEDLLKTRIQNNEAHTFTVIVPNDSARLKRQRELVGYHPNRAVANLRVYTSVAFVRRLYSQAHPSRQHISEGIQSLWLHEIANPQPDNPDAHRYDTFRPNPNISVPDSTLSLVIDKIKHLKERGETSEDIAADNPTKTGLARIYSDYETKLEDGWIDEQGRHLYLANNFEPKFMRNAFYGVNLVVVEGFTVLSKADTKILTRIAEMPNIEMWFRTDYVPENQALYKNIDDIVSQFTEANAIIDPDYERDPDRHKNFSENLFRTETGSVNSGAAPETAFQIKMMRPVDRSDEVEQIASLIQKRVSEGHCKLSDICVAYYNIGQYQQRIAEIFPAYGIPYSLGARAPITRSEIVKSIFSHLSSDRTPMGIDYFSDVEKASDTNRFHPNAFQEYVDKLLKKGEVVRRVLNPMLEKNSEIVEGEVEAYRQFQRIVTELCKVLRSESEKSYPLSEYIDKLLRIARHTNYHKRTSTKGETVKIVPLGELRSMAFDTVFLGDFVESRFPANFRPDPILPEIPYRDEEEQLCDNRFLFYRVLKSFREQLYLLIPKREGEADLIPSPFLRQLKAITNVETIEPVHPTHGSVPSFLSTYGSHAWTAEISSNKPFPGSLTSIRPLIDHVIKVEKSREKTHEHLAYEGVLTAGKLSEESRDQLQRLHNKHYSVTELESYAKCPFQYFANKGLKLSIKDDELEDELSNLERGSLLHEVIFTFCYNRREREYPSIRQCTNDVFEEAKRQLNDILDNASENYRRKRNEPPVGENNLFWETDVGKLRVALYKWLEAERTNDVQGHPCYFEVGFGPEDRERRTELKRDPELSCTEPIFIGDVRMAGKIDRIDIGNGVFNIIDYKTGSSTIRMPEILSGQSLQLPVYLQIAKALLESKGVSGLNPAAGLYYKIRLNECKVELGIGVESENGNAYKNFNGSDWRPCGKTNGQLVNDEIFDGLLSRVSGYVQQYVDSISEGKFPLITRVETFVDAVEEGDTPIAPKNKTAPCSYCDYKRICRVGAISETPQSDD